MAYIFVDAAPSTTDPACSSSSTTSQARSPAPSDQRCWRLLSSHRVPLVRGQISSTDSPMTSHVYRRRVDELAPTLARTESTGGHSHGDHRLDKVASCTRGVHTCRRIVQLRVCVYARFVRASRAPPSEYGPWASSHTRMPPWDPCYGAHRPDNRLKPPNAPPKPTRKWALDPER